MKALSQLVVAFFFIFAVDSFAQVVQSDPEADLSGQIQAQVVKINLLDYSSSKVVLGLTLAISSKRDLTVEQIILGNLRINGLPLYAAPVKQRIQLHAGEKTLLPDPLPVTIYLRDLDSIAPLEEAVSNGHTTLDGAAYATVRLNPLATVVLLSHHVEVAMSLHEDVLPFTVPGGPVAQKASLAVLRTADKALRAVGNAVSSGRNWASGFRHDTMKQYAPHLLLAYAQFELRDRNGQTTTAPWCGVALAAAPDLLLIPREALEPWKFDAEIADAIQGKRLAVNKSSYDLWLWPVGTWVLNARKELNFDSAMRLSQQQISVVKTPDQDKRKLLALGNSGQTQKVSVAKRDSPSDLALLRVAKPSRNFEALSPPADDTTTSWDSVALFRFRDCIHGSPAEPELIVVPAKRNGNRIELGELVDSSAFGSPIIAPEGMIGIVQDESSGVVWPEATRALTLDKFEAVKK